MPCLEAHRIVAVVQPTSNGAVVREFCCIQADMFPDVMQILDEVKNMNCKYERLGTEK